VEFLLSKRKSVFIKDDVPIDDDFVGEGANATVSFVIRGITKKVVQGRARGKQLVESG
jgi:hypothetical protein